MVPVKLPHFHVMDIKVKISVKGKFWPTSGSYYVKEKHYDDNQKKTLHGVWHGSIHVIPQEDQLLPNGICRNGFFDRVFIYVIKAPNQPKQTTNLKPKQPKTQWSPYPASFSVSLLCTRSALASWSQLLQSSPLSLWIGDSNKGINSCAKASVHEKFEVLVIMKKQVSNF